MIISNFLKNRKSVREFRNKKIKEDILEAIKKDLREIEEETECGKIQFKLYGKEDPIYSNLKGKAGYAGVMIESPYYLALIRKDDEESTKIRSGYYMEKAITGLIEKDLGTCWVSVKNVDEESMKKAFGDYEGTIDYILALGYQKLQNPFNTETFSERIAVEEYVFDGDLERESNVEDLEAKGLLDIFYYLRFAPSTKNLQPWRFLIKDNKIELYLVYREWKEAFLIDVGIIMYYFEILAKSQGIDNKWVLSEPLEKETDNFIYKLVAEYKL